MDHLITPIEVDGNLKCIKHGKPAFAASPYRTESVIADLYGTVEKVGAENDDLWLWENNSGGNVTFGFCCFWKIKLRFTFVESDNEHHITIRLNPGRLDEQVIAQHATWVDGVGDHDPWEIEIDMNAEGVMGIACGNTLDVEGSVDNGGTLSGEKMRMEVISVTLGPPV